MRADISEVCVTNTTETRPKLECSARIKKLAEEADVFLQLQQAHSSPDVRKYNGFFISELHKGVWECPVLASDLEFAYVLEQWSQQTESFL